MKKYRIYRVNKYNIAIQEMRGKKSPYWCTISYHGNSPSSLVSGLLELIIAQHTPEQDKLLEQLKNLELAIVSGVEEIRELIDDSQRID